MLKEMTPNLLDLGREHWIRHKIVEKRIKFETLTLDLARVRGRKHKYASRDYPNPRSTRVRGRNEANRCKLKSKTKP
jgi:hypothetical protein